MRYFRDATGITAEPPEEPSRTIGQIIDDIWQNRDRDYNIRCLVKRLQRIDKQMSGDARADFAAFISDGDLAKYAAHLPGRLRADFTGSMALLRDPAFQHLLLHYKRPPRTFVVAHGVEDTVTAEWHARDATGRDYKPEDYLLAFARFVRENPAHIEAIQILLDRPQDWNTAALTELRQKLAAAPQRFTEEQLRKAHQIRYGVALADIISMVKHAAGLSPTLFTAQERAGLAVQKVARAHDLTAEQRRWLDRIRDHLIENLTVDRDDFAILPVFTRAGGWTRANRAFDGHLPQLIQELNEAIAA